jgi:hypothetical protein
MNRAEVLAAFNRQVRQGTTPDGTGATFETGSGTVTASTARLSGTAELARGCKYLTVDACGQSQPILERIGFERLAVTTPNIRRP